MSTYNNAYEILSEVRRGINEYSTAKVQGTDTSGAFSNADITKKINDAQKYLYDLLLNRQPQLFYKKTTLTPSSGVLTMPSDFYRIRRLEDDEGNKLHEKQLEEKHTENESGSLYHYWWQGGYIYLDRENYSTDVTLYYVYRPREIHAGMTSAGGALSATLDATYAKKIADYYNDMDIEDITGDAIDTISDYTAARVATVANTWAASRYYGLVSELPEAFHPFIGRKAVMLMRESYGSLKSPSQVEIGQFNEDLNETLKSYFGQHNTNTDIADLFK